MRETLGYLRACVQERHSPRREDVSPSDRTTSHNVKVAPAHVRRGNVRQTPLKRRPRISKSKTLALAVVVASLPITTAESCISLSKSTQCSAFNASSISVDSTLTALFSFLSNVTDVTSFDSGIQTYISGAFAEERYKVLIGCSSFSASNTTDYYARYTTSVLCNAIIQNSISTCGLSGDATAPLCAESCAEYASSEEDITDSNICGTAGSGALSEIRADFTNCALPADSLSTTCIQAVTNQPDNCGYSDNLSGLCSYCSSSSTNSTDSCCLYSDTETRCSGVTLPIAAISASSIAFTTASSTTSATTTATSSASSVSTVSHNRALSAGAIAGIVIGAILGALLLLGLLVLACLMMRRKHHQSPASSVRSHPVHNFAAAPMSRHDGAEARPREMTALPGGRITRMAAIEGERKEPPMFAAGGAYDSSTEEDTPRSYNNGGAPPQRGRSLGANSPFAVGAMDSSPGEGLSSPEGTGQSEQLNFFKDYYSQDEIHPGDLLAALWAYQPRAGDEFELERGDMIKVVGIWDDGWATGVRVRQRAEDWRGSGQMLRDSGLSSGNTSPETDNDVKAFPLVCVCLPQHWRKTIEGETTEDSTYPDDTPSSP